MKQDIATVKNEKKKKKKEQKRKKKEIKKYHNFIVIIYFCYDNLVRWTLSQLFYSTKTLLDRVPCKCKIPFAADLVLHEQVVETNLKFLLKIKK